LMKKKNQGSKILRHCPFKIKLQNTERLFNCFSVFDSVNPYFWR
jgi:hypothetical protein